MKVGRTGVVDGVVLGLGAIVATGRCAPGGSVSFSTGSSLCLGEDISFRKALCPGYVEKRKRK